MALQETYGKKDTACVAKVKNLYKELNLEVCLPLMRLSIYL
jgi:farnesyl diphosphate synthase